MSQRQRPVSSCLMLTAKLEEFVTACEVEACTAIWDRDAGTVEVFDDGDKVLSAIQKGNKHQPWIVMFFNAGRITWSKP